MVKAAFLKPWASNTVLYYYCVYYKIQWNSLYIQLNKYQTDHYLLELSHQITNVCLMISDFFTHFCLFLHVGNTKLFCTSKNQNKQFCFPVLQIFSNLGKFLEINERFLVKLRQTYQSYSSVWWILSCNWCCILTHLEFHQNLILINQTNY